MHGYLLSELSGFQGKGQYLGLSKANGEEIEGAECNLGPGEKPACGAERSG